MRRLLGFFLCLTLSTGSSLRGHRKLKLFESDNAIVDQFIVQFDRARVRNAMEKARVMVEEIGGIEIVSTFNLALKGASFSGVSSNALQKILDDEDVMFVEQDATLETSLDDEQENIQTKFFFPKYKEPGASVVDLGTGVQEKPATWGLDRIDQLELPLDDQFRFGETTGQGVDVYIIDSGILETHSEFGGRAKCSKNLVPDETCEDVRGHGTFVAATIGGSTYGVAKGVTIKAVKIIPKNGSTTYSNLIAGVNHVIFERVKSFMKRTPIVLNMSVGGKHHTMLNLAASSAANLGIVVVASAGNNGVNACNYSPGSAGSVITVGATNDYDSRPWYSNYGRCVNIFAPGDSIQSAGISSATASDMRSGTSMAAPFVAGAVALLIERYPDMGASAIKRTLLEEASQDAVSRAGYESQNRFLQVGRSKE